MALQRFMGKHNRVADYTGAWLNHNEDLFYAMLGDSTLKWKIPSTAKPCTFPSRSVRLTCIGWQAVCPLDATLS